MQLMGRGGAACGGGEGAGDTGGGQKQTKYKKEKQTNRPEEKYNMQANKSISTCRAAKKDCLVHRGQVDLTGGGFSFFFFARYICCVNTRTATGA